MVVQGERFVQRGKQLALWVLLATGMAGCIADPPAARHHVSPEVRERNVQAALRAHAPKISPTAIEYVTDSMAIHDGSTVAVFPAALDIRRNANGMSVFDRSSGQTFQFSPRATVSTSIGMGRLYLEPWETMPRWAVEANARRAR
jgi:hypothetical protein